MSNNNPADQLSDKLKKEIETSQELMASAKPMLDEQKRIQELTNLSLPSVAALKALSNNVIINIPEITMPTIVPEFKYVCQNIDANIRSIQNAASAMTSALIAYINSDAVKVAQNICSTIGTWLKNIDFSPLTEIINNTNFSEALQKNGVLKELFLEAMFESKWFPYAGWIADMDIFTEINQILASSRKTDNRTKRIDRVLFSYYSKKELMNIKRSWRKKDLPNYMLRIMIQSVQAYNRREYALTVSSLSTLWEGIIAEKSNTADNYRISSKTRDNLLKLIEINNFASVFSSFCDEFIFYDCHNKEEVKQDVPGRHGIAHCWYDQYPSRKAALNAILFSDFLIYLKPLEIKEEK